jgi:hypothetical protein
VQQFRRIAAAQNPNVQMILPLAEVVARYRKESATCSGKLGWH